MSITRCSVIGCPENTQSTTKLLLKFPLGSDVGGFVAKLWQDFTRQPGVNVAMLRICRDHFSEKCIKENKNGKKVLKKDSVPTIFITKGGGKVMVPYDPLNFQYFNYNLEHLWNQLDPPPIYDSALLTIRLEKITELKSLCRFCFTKNSMTVSTSHLETFGMNPVEILKEIGSNLEHHENFSDLICESCILKVIEIEKFKNLCCTNQVKIEKELRSLDEKIKDMVELCGEATIKIEENWFEVKVDNVKISERSEYRRLEKIFARNRADIAPKIDCPLVQIPQNNSSTNLNDSFSNVNHLNDTNPLSDDLNVSNLVTVKSEDSQITEVTIKAEPNAVYSDDDYDQGETYIDYEQLDDHDSDFDKEFVNDVEIKKDKNLSESDSGSSSESEYRKRRKKPRKVVEDTTKEVKTTPKSKPQNKSTPKVKQENKIPKVYQCFFCMEKIVGSTNYRVHHKCKVKHRICEVEDCGEKFISQSGFTTHQMRRHCLPKIMQHYCPCCNSCLQLRSIEFQTHCLACKPADYKEVPIDCNICKKNFESLDAYVEHVIEHDSKGLDVKIDDTTGEVTITKKVIRTGRKKSDAPPKKQKYDPNKKTERFCDLCGKVFSSSATFIVHRHRVHLTTFKGEMFKCLECPFEGKSKVAIRDHVRDVHRCDPTDCPICGKTFQTNRKMMRHKKFTHEPHKMAIKCEICPSRPGFKSNTLLQKHIAVTHGVGSAAMVGFKCSVEGCDAAYATEKNLQKHLENIHGF